MDRSLATARWSTLRVSCRTAVAVANAPSQPVWNPASEFREAGERRVGFREVKRRWQGSAGLPERAGIVYFAAVSFLPTRECLWNCLRTTGFRSPG